MNFEKTYEQIEALLNYTIAKKLMRETDSCYTRNRILVILELAAYNMPKRIAPETNLPQILEGIFSKEIRSHCRLEYNYQVEIKKVAIMDIFIPLPSIVQQQFFKNYEISPVLATKAFYEFCEQTDYIKETDKNQKWKQPSKYGLLDITINLAKPEKDPKEITALFDHKKNTETYYPQCQLCIENEGYGGRSTHPPRTNLRLIPLNLNNEHWYFQFSPYGYYDEHAIILKREHSKMKTDAATITRLFDFVDQFPHYFIGSNADIPIVGGSILNHDHFQGGFYEFPIMRAAVKSSRIVGNTNWEILDWPVATLRISGNSRVEIQAQLEIILAQWKVFSDPNSELIARTNNMQHNAITPFVRKKAEMYEYYIAFRNNRINTEFPGGIFHPHQEFHHIKKENIGLIEVMGVAILPARLKAEIEDILNYFGGINATAAIQKHLPWLQKLAENINFQDGSRQENEKILENEIGKIFIKVLEQTYVFADDTVFFQFLEKCEVEK
ncbi:galactose-1-phosphate uridylyltransferase [Erysipelotrichaceae bacterium]|nr:galactose-1-phosphate uridylyltransferase [Erysipelotrichaceae bacterium]